MSSTCLAMSKCSPSVIAVLIGNRHFEKKNILLESNVLYDENLFICCIQGKDLEPSLVAAKFLSEAISCNSFNDNDPVEKVTWQLPQEFMPIIDQAVGFYCVPLVELSFPHASGHESVRAFCFPFASQGCIQGKDLEPSLVAAKFLSEAISCNSFNDNDPVEKVTWQLPQEFMPIIDQAVGFYCVPLVEVVLKRIASGCMGGALREALTDMLYGLCIRYKALTESAILCALDTEKTHQQGTLTEMDKKLFVSAVFRNPPHPRQRFRGCCFKSSVVV
eukprot:Gb_04133 [translate_table: standard]